MGLIIPVTPRFKPKQCSAIVWRRTLLLKRVFYRHRVSITQIFNRVGMSIYDKSH